MLGRLFYNRIPYVDIPVHHLAVVLMVREIIKIS